MGQVHSSTQNSQLFVLWKMHISALFFQAGATSSSLTVSHNYHTNQSPIILSCCLGKLPNSWIRWLQNARHPPTISIHCFWAALFLGIPTSMSSAPSSDTDDNNSGNLMWRFLFANVGDNTTIRGLKRFILLAPTLYAFSASSGLFWQILAEFWLLIFGRFKTICIQWNVAESCLAQFGRVPKKRIWFGSLWDPHR